VGHEGVHMLQGFRRDDGSRPLLIVIYTAPRWGGVCTVYSRILVLRIVCPVSWLGAHGSPLSLPAGSPAATT
jgi:hypothetical protein